MEPLSTLVLTAAFLATAPATRQPRWVWETVSDIRSELNFGVNTQFLLPTPATIATPETQDSLSVPVVQALSPKELLMREVLTYSEFADGWNGVGSKGPTQQATKAATMFIDAVPAQLPLPRPMLSSNGEIGIYWGLEGGYVEATFEPTGKFTFFSRDTNGKERFNEGLKIADLSDNWFWEAIGYLDVIAEAA
ncbi:MAG: hypothetical protein PHF20_03090 [Halothiobacillaceae bacterium]|nr:hypothetical protein [Halothiobacillaceae bacterium]